MKERDLVRLAIGPAADFLSAREIIELHREVLFLMLSRPPKRDQTLG